jgi:hypothetical protein
MNFEVAIIGISLAGQERLELAPGDLDPQSLERGFRFTNCFFVLLRFTEFDQGELVFKLLFDATDCFQLIVKRIALPHDTLRARLIVPEIRVFRLFVQFGQAPHGNINVKDASLAAALTA